MRLLFLGSSSFNDSKTIAGPDIIQDWLCERGPSGAKSSINYARQFTADIINDQAGYLLKLSVKYPQHVVVYV